MENWSKESFERYFNDELEDKLKGYSEEWRIQIKYPINSGGKRFRPALVFNSGCGKIGGAELFKIGAAVEILHSATLVHDDLPSIDNDDYRRGRLSSHKIYGEGVALTGGDFMFFLSQKIIGELGCPDLCVLFSECAMDTAYGEALDIKFERLESVCTSDILAMYEMKTARLIQFSICAPAVFYGAEMGVVNKLWDAGRFFGLAFQLLDDVKDVNGSFKELGKTPGKDLEQNKHTLVKYEGVERTLDIAAEYWEKGFGILDSAEEIWDSKSLREYLNKSWEKIKNT